MLTRFIVSIIAMFCVGGFLFAYHGHPMTHFWAAAVSSTVLGGLIGWLVASGGRK